MLYINQHAAMFAACRRNFCLALPCRSRGDYYVVLPLLASQVMMLGAIAGTEMALIDAGYTSFTPGVGVGEAIKYWQSTSAVIKSRELA